MGEGGMSGKGVEVKDFCATCYRKNGSGMEKEHPGNKVQFNLSTAFVTFGQNGVLESVDGYGFNVPYSDKDNRLVLVEYGYQLLINPWQA